MQLFLSSTLRVALLLSLVLAPNVPAEVLSLTVSVDGMACPFCTFGVEKKLSQVEGVESVAINLAQGTAELRLAENSVPTLQAIRVAITKAGFTAGTIRLTALGTLTIGTDRIDLNVRASDRSYRLRGSGEKQEAPLDKDFLQQLSALGERGVAVSITGTLRAESDLTTSLQVEKVEQVHTLALQVEEMHCEDCVSRATGLIEQFPGAYRVSVSLEDKRAVVESIGIELDASALISTLADAGFDAKIVSGG